MRHRLRTVVLLVVIGIFFSCKKEEADPPKTKTELLTARPWKRTALTSQPAYDWNGNGTSDTDIMKIMLACEKDNLEYYKTDGTVETNEGATKCDPGDPQTWTSTWEFKDNETRIVWNATDEYDLVELTETTLRLRITFVENGVTYTHNESYAH